MDSYASSIFQRTLYIENDVTTPKHSCTSDVVIKNITTEVCGSGPNDISYNILGWVSVGGIYIHTNVGMFYLCTQLKQIDHRADGSTIITEWNPHDVDCPDEYLVFTVLRPEHISIDININNHIKYTTTYKDNGLSFGQGTTIDVKAQNTLWLELQGSSSVSDDDTGYTSQCMNVYDSNGNIITVIDKDHDANPIEINKTEYVNGNISVSRNMKINDQITNTKAYRYGIHGIYVLDSPIFEEEDIVFASGNIISPNIARLEHAIDILSTEINRLNNNVEHLMAGITVTIDKK